MSLLLWTVTAISCHALGMKSVESPKALMAVSSEGALAEVDATAAAMCSKDNELDVFFIRHGQGNHNWPKQLLGERDAALNDVGIAQAIAGAMLLRGQNVREFEKLLDVLKSSGVAFAASPLNRAYTTLLLFLASTAQVSSPRLHVLEVLQEIPQLNEPCDKAGKRSPHLFKPADSLMQVNKGNATVSDNLKKMAQLSGLPTIAPTDKNVREICAAVEKLETADSTYILFQRNKSVPFAEGFNGVADQTTAQKLFEVAKLEGKKVVFVGGHSNWFATFMKRMPKADAFSASPLGKYLQSMKFKLKNGEVVRLRLVNDTENILITEVASVVPGFKGLGMNSDTPGFNALKPPSQEPVKPPSKEPAKLPSQEPVKRKGGPSDNTPSLAFLLFLVFLS